MARPSTYDPLITRCYEVLCKGAGVTRTITAGRFAARLYPGQPADNQHKEALAASERSPTRLAGLVAVFVEQFADTEGTQEFSDVAQYDVRLRVDVSYATPNPAQRSVGAPTVDLVSAALAQAASDAHAIRRALCWPPSMVATTGGLDTGLAGGGGVLPVAFGPVRHDPATQTVTATLYFRAIVFLALS